MTDGEKVMAIAKIAYRSKEVNEEIWRLFKKYVDKNNMFVGFVTGCGCPNDISHRWRDLIEDFLQYPNKYDNDDSKISDSNDVIVDTPKKSSKINKK